MSSAAVELASAMTAAWTRTTAAGRAMDAPGQVRDPRKYLWASQLWRCARRSAFDLLNPGFVSETFTDHTLERFERGKEREEALVARLARVGKFCDPPYSVVESQIRFELKDRDAVTLASGKIDGRIQFTGIRERPVFEVKSGRMAESIETWDDLYDSPWTQSWGRQLLMYLYALNEPWGMLVMDTWGAPNLIPVVLEDHLVELEETLQRARAAVDAAAGGDLPHFVRDRELCGACPYYRSKCVPDEDAGEGIEVISDPGIEELCRQVMEYAEQGKAYDRARGRLSKALRGTRLAQIGPYLFEGTVGSMTRYDVPKDVKKQYKTESETFSFKLSRVGLGEQ